jgi:hypothetical protein
LIDFCLCFDPFAELGWEIQTGENYTPGFRAIALFGQRSLDNTHTKGHQRMVVLLLKNYLNGLSCFTLKLMIKEVRHTSELIWI